MSEQIELKEEQFEPKPKEVLVVFSKIGAKIIKDEAQFVVHKNNPNKILNPDLSLVKGTPPHFWKIGDGKILPMNSEERKNRMIDIGRIELERKARVAKAIADKQINLVSDIKVIPKKSNLPWIVKPLVGKISPIHIISGLLALGLTYLSLKK